MNGHFVARYADSNVEGEIFAEVCLAPNFYQLSSMSYVLRYAGPCRECPRADMRRKQDMWLSPEEYANKYRISLPSLYPALRAGRVPNAKRVMGRAWRIWDEVVNETEKEVARQAS